jgi:hypothetical protein
VVSVFSLVRPLDYEAITDELREFRELRHADLPNGIATTHPVSGGWWFGWQDFWHHSDERRRIRRCWMCGDPDKLYRDHCHHTGLGRGMLCPSCNSLESTNGPDSSLWNAWRLTAPQLSVGARYIYRAETSLFTHNELMTTEIYRLLERVADDNEKHYRAVPAPVFPWDEVE